MNCWPCFVGKHTVFELCSRALTGTVAHALLFLFVWLVVSFFPVCALIWLTVVLELFIMTWPSFWYHFCVTFPLELRALCFFCRPLLCWLCCTVYLKSGVQCSVHLCATTAKRPNHSSVSVDCTLPPPPFTSATVNEISWILALSPLPLPISFHTDRTSPSCIATSEIEEKWQEWDAENQGKDQWQVCFSEMFENVSVNAGRR